jgi:hypothetical protein
MSMLNILYKMMLVPVLFYFFFSRMETAKRKIKMLSFPHGLTKEVVFLSYVDVSRFRFISPRRTGERRRCGRTERRASCAPTGVS